MADRKNIIHTEFLARIALPDSSVEEFGQRLSKVFEWIDQLKSVDIEGVEPLTTPVMALMETTPLREDKHEQPPSPDLILENAPEKDFDFFMVPKVVE